MTPASPRAAPDGRRPRARRAVLRAFLSVLLALVLLEGGLRLVLFAPGPLADLAAPLRRPGLYFASDVDEGYWKLEHLLRGSAPLEPSFAFDPLLGWRVATVDADHRHVLLDATGGPLPVLLYGDSFAMCLTPPRDCFEGILAGSRYGDAAVIANHGGAGYGLDQIHLMVRESAPHWRERGAVAVVAVFVGDDLNRSMLRLRVWPKPRFRLVDGELELTPPGARTAAEWVRDHPPRAVSYLARWLLFGSGLADGPLRARLTDRGERLAEARALNRRLILATRDELERSGLPYFFLLLPGQRDLRRPEPWGWQERLLLDVLEEHGVPYETARPDLLAALEEEDRPPTDYFERGHYTRLGNEVAFRALERGLVRLVR